MSREALAKARLRAFTRAGQVVRFHTRPQLHPQNVAAHSFGVAWLCWVLTEGAASKELLYAALLHDVPEFLTGDLPSPTKSEVGGESDGPLAKLERRVLERAGLPEPTLTEDERRVLHLADCLEGLLHCARERALGNRLLDSSYARYLAASRQLAKTDVEEYVLGFINHHWRKHVRN